MSAIVSESPAVDPRSTVALGVRILNSLDMMDMNGHVSVRHPDRPDRIFINSRRASRSTLRFSDIVEVDLAVGKRVGDGDEPPGEFHIHRAIMLRRPDVGAVVHSHPDHIVTLSIAGKKLLPVTGIGSFLPEDVPVFDDASLINTEDRGEAIAELLADGPIVVLRGHGVVITGSSVEEAIARYVCAEQNARIQYKAHVIGEPHVLRGAELERVRRETWTPVITAKHWHYHKETARRAGAFEGLE